MQVQLLVERDQNECIVNLAGTAYKFKRNEYGHLVSDITDHDDIKWVSDPHNRTAFKAYIDPKNMILDAVIDEAVPVADKPAEAVQEEAQRQTDVNPSTDTNDAPKLPRFPKKGSKRPPKRCKS